MRAATAAPTPSPSLPGRGDEPEIPDFASLAADEEIAALLDFEPVPRKIEVPGGWSPDRQRELIARLAVHGSPNRACDEMAAHRTGLTKVYKSPFAKSFRESWAQAIALATRRRKEREAAGFVAPGAIPPTLDGRRAPSPLAGEGRGEGAWRPAEPLPVVCDSCRAEGAAGDEAFSAIPDILAFDPVPRAAHDKLWPAETQRAFIAALAVTGSVVRAARSVGRHAFGVEKLRKGRGARGFNEAFEAALDLARERELSRLHGKLDQLASPPAEGEERGGQVINELGEYEDAASYERRGEEARASIFEKLQRMRRNMLRDEIMPDPEKRAAWILLNGPEEIEAIEAGTWKAEDWRAENAQS